MAYACSACRILITRKWGYCWTCERDWLRLRPGRCADCKKPLPRGQQLKRCTDCQRGYTQRLAARPIRLCQCGSRIPRGYTRHACPDCRSIETQEYKARKRLVRDGVRQEAISP